LWPHERSLVKDLKNQPFALIGVNTNGYPAEKLKAVMEQENLGWRSFVNVPGGKNAGRGRPISDHWNLAGTPTLYVLDHKGVIRYRWLGVPPANVIDEVLSRLIREAEQDKGASK